MLYRRSGRLRRGLGRWFGACRTVRGRRDGRNDPSQLDLVDIWEMGLQVGIALVGDQVLARHLAVNRIDFVDDIHTFNDVPKRGKTHGVKASVVGKIDKELGGAGVGSGSGEDKVAALVALHNRIIRNGGSVPDLIHGRVGAEPELHHEAGNHAKEGRIGEVAIAHQVVKSVCPERRPVAMDFDDEVARRGGELCLENRGSLGLERCRIEQGRTRPGSRAAGRCGL